jgi:hypothetical protein
MTLTMGALALSCTSANTNDAGPGAAGGKCVEYKVPASTDLTKPVVGFATQVVPILQRNCSYGECHGKAVFPVLGFYGGGGADGGEDPNPPTAEQIRENLVDKPSQILTSMKVVAPGDPKNSFMMRTMDGDHCLFNAKCVNGNCGEQMPNDRAVLSIQERDYVRRWIAQGAK